MSLFVDTSAWSLAFRRDEAAPGPHVAALRQALEEGQTIVTTGLVLQELLQGFSGPKGRALILEHFSAIPLLAPDRDDHIEAATLRNDCRSKGVQAATIDALIAHLCIRHSLTLLSADREFERIARHTNLKIWQGRV
jgi:predicted nucleic acid-binding protein